MFKNTFGVTGSRKQLEAFAEWAEGIGWVRRRDTIHRDGLFFVGSNNKGWDAMVGKFWLCCTNGVTPTYHLPTQYAEAYAAASEKEEVKFEVGKKYKLNQRGVVIICTDTNRHDTFVGTVIQTSIPDHYALGEHRTDWIQSSFTPYPDPITI